MGMSESYGGRTTRSRSRRSTARWSSASPFSTPPTCTGGHNEESSAGRSPAAVTRSCWRRSSARARQDRSVHGRHGRPENVRRPATPAHAARRRPHRPVLPAPGRPAGADRGHRRSDGRAGQAGKVRHLGLSEAAPRRSRGRTPCTRSPRCRPSSRCGPATSRTRSSPLPRLGIGLVPFSRSAAVS